MKKIIALLSIGGVLLLCGKYYFTHRITLELAIFCLIVTGIIAFADRPFWHVIKAIVAIFTIGLFFGGNAFAPLIQPFLVLFVAALGLYIIIRAIFRKSDNNEIDITINPRTGKVKRKDSWW